MGETIQPNDTIEKLQGDPGGQPQESLKKVGKTMPIYPGNDELKNSQNLDNESAENGTQNLKKRLSSNELDDTPTLGGFKSYLLQKKQSLATGIDEIKKMDREQMESHFEDAKKFYNKASTLLKQSPGVLNIQEPEKEPPSPYGPWIKKVLFWVIVTSIVIYTLMTNLSKIGTEKSQEVTILKHTELMYDITGASLYKLLPLHFFTSFNKNEVIRRMECLVNEKKDACNAYEMRKCQVLGLTNPQYDDCMLEQYSKAGLELSKFCDGHYDDSSNKIWTKAEQQSNFYLTQKYNCLTNAGVSQGQSFCQDQYRIKNQTELQLYNCYISKKVANSTFADKRCNILHPMKSPDSKVRDQYKECMKQSGEDAEKDQEFVCFNDNPWKMDQFFFDACESTRSFDTDLKQLKIPVFDEIPQENEEEFDFYYYGDLSSFTNTQKRRLQTQEPKPFLAMLEGGAVFEMDTSFSDAYKDPLLDSAKGAQSGPAPNCNGNAEWTVTMSNSKGYVVDQLVWQKRGDTNPKDKNYDSLFVSQVKIKYYDTNGNWVDYNSGGYVQTGQNADTPVETKLQIDLVPFIASQVKIIMDEKSNTINKCRNARFDLRVQEYVDMTKVFIPEISPYTDFESNYPGYIPSKGQKEIDAEFEKILQSNPDLSWKEVMDQIDTSEDLDFNYIAPKQTAFTKSAFGTASRSTCSKYFQAGLDVSSCYEQKVLKWEIETCNTYVFNRYIAEQLSQKKYKDFEAPPPQQYFQCYFQYTRMLPGEDYQQEHKDACDSLYSDQQDRMNCYLAVNIKPTAPELIKVCTNKYQLQSQVDKLYKCLSEFGVQRSVDYCNLNPSQNVLDFSYSEIQRINYETLDGLQYFDCIKNVNREPYQPRIDKLLDARICTDDHVLNQKFRQYADANPTKYLGKDSNRQHEPEKCVEWYTDGKKRTYEELSDCCALKSSSQGPGGQCLDSFELVWGDICDQNLNDDGTQNKQNPNLFSYECLPSVESLVDYGAKKDCLDYFKMPSQSVDEYICNERYFPELGKYKSTGKACSDRFDDICYEYLGTVLTSKQCNSIYTSLYEPRKDRESFEKHFAVQCVRLEVDTQAYDWCMKEAKVQGELNAKNDPNEESKKKMDEDQLNQYCQDTFKEQNPYNYVECMKYIGQPLGVDECFLLPEYKYVKNVNFFNYYQKYICLSLKETVLDPEVNTCILGDKSHYPGQDMNIVEINECLKNYEQEPGFKMDLKKLGGIAIYKKAKRTAFDDAEEYYVEDDIMFEEVPDRITTLKNEQFEKFLCKDHMSLIFTSTPFQKVVDFKRKNFNSMRFDMDCGIFTEFNGTHNNTITHFSFPEEYVRVNLTNSTVFDETFNDTHLLVKRTDTNKQQFNLTLNQALNFLEIGQHYVAWYDSQEFVNISDGNEFLEFTTHPNTSTLINTNGFVVFDETSQPTNVKADPLKVVEIDKIVTRRILGVPISYEDDVQKKLDFKKVDDPVRALKRGDLSPKERRDSGSSYLVNLIVDFSEQTVEYQFFTLGDIVGKLGGLLATYNSIMGSYAVIAIVLYVYNFASMTKRKDKQEIRKIEVTQYLKHIPDIQDSIKEQISNETGKLKDTLVEELANIEDALSIQMDTYRNSQLKLDLLKEILEKYYPIGVSDLFCKDACTSEWESLQVYEQEKRHAYLTSKINLSWGQIIDDIQARLSIYGVYALFDWHVMEDIKLEQQAEQLKNANDRIQNLEKKSQ